MFESNEMNGYGICSKDGIVVQKGVFKNGKY